jgi:hypothetical protein
MGAMDNLVQMAFRLRRVHADRVLRYREMAREQRRDIVDVAGRRVLERNWVATPGYTMPNRKKYPWQWLWDSCFHAVAWSRLGDPRGVTELETALSLQLSNGFVAHMGYHTDPNKSLALWHVPARSDITQPPMYGHALRVLAERGFAVDHLHDAATAGLAYLFERRRDPDSGLIRVVHPWETGCDDSPRWDGWHAQPFSERRWNARKRELVRTIELRDGAASANPGFDVGSAGFSALVAFNARELAACSGNEDLLSSAYALAESIDAQWVESRRTWGDVWLAGPHTSSAARTLDALFPVLVSGTQRFVDAAFAQIFDPRCFWRPFGPPSTSAGEPSYDPGLYWRGDAWPQEIYLLMVAAKRCGRQAEAARLAAALAEGCVGSGHAERWNPETGAGLGAIPQGWAALAGEGLRTLE